MLDVATVSIVGLAMVFFSIGMAHVFYSSKRRGWKIVLCWLLFLVASVALGEILRPVLGNRSGQFSGFLAIGAYAYLFAVPVRERLFTYFFIDTSMYLTVLLARYTVLLLGGFFPGLNAQAAFVILYFALTTAYVFAFFRWLRVPIHRRLEQFGAQLGSLTGFACIGYVVMLLLFDVWETRDSVTFAGYLPMLLYVALLFCGYYLSFFSMAAVRDSMESKNRVAELTGIIRQSEQYYTALTGHIQEVRRIQHDTRHHLRVLGAYLQDQEYDRMREYISSMAEVLPHSKGEVFCANYTANILIEYYGDKAGEADIRFHCDTQIPGDIPVDPAHLSMILGNALQNALEACRRMLPDRAQYISLFSRMVGENLTLEVRNSYDGVVVERDGVLLTRKPESGHGLGLSSIDNVARQYHGYSATERSEGEFILRVVLALSR